MHFISEISTSEQEPRNIFFLIHAVTCPIRFSISCGNEHPVCRYNLKGRLCIPTVEKQFSFVIHATIYYVNKYSDNWNFWKWKEEILSTGDNIWLWQIPLFYFFSHRMISYNKPDFSNESSTIKRSNPLMGFLFKCPLK